MRFGSIPQEAMEGRFGRGTESRGGEAAGGFPSGAPTRHVNFNVAPNVTFNRRELTRWVENRWILPERRGTTWIFHEIDVARVELIIEVRREFAIDDEAVSLMLGLLDQVYDLRRQLGRLCDALAAQPLEIQAAIKRALPRPLDEVDQTETDRSC